MVNPTEKHSLSKWNWRNWSLKFQIIIGIVLIQSLFTLSLVLYQFQTQKNLLEKQSLDEAKGVIMSLAASTISRVLTHDFAEIDDLIKAHAKNTNVEFVEIYDSEKRRIGIFNGIAESRNVEKQKSGHEGHDYHEDENE